MSAENVEALRRAAEAVNNKDPAVLEELVHLDVVWEPKVNAPDLVGTFRGIDEVKRWFIRWEKAWEHWEWTFHDLEPEGENVFARMHLMCRGRTSGIDTEWNTWQVWRFRDGKVIHYRDYENREEALEAMRSPDESR